MNQFEEQRNNQHLNQQSNKFTLKRSVSPICKLIIFNNLNSNIKTQKSMRAKDDTLILDVLLYLEQQHENKCTITLYHNNNPIDVNKNTYLLPYLQKLKIQQLDYKAQDNRLYQSEIGIEDEGPGLEQKLNERDSSSWGKNLSRLKQNNLQGETQETNNILMQQISPRNNNFKQSQLPYEKVSQNNSSTQSTQIPDEKVSQNNFKSTQLPDDKVSQNNSSTQFLANMKEERNRSDNNSEYTIQSIQGCCKKSYNSKELKKILMDAMNKKYIAQCQMCQQKIPRSMYSQIEVFGRDYHYLKLSLELEILKKDLIQKMNIQKCQFCNFFCIWDKSKQSVQRFCPNCLQNCMISNNY